MPSRSSPPSSSSVRLTVTTRPPSASSALCERERAIIREAISLAGVGGARATAARSRASVAQHAARFKATTTFTIASEAAPCVT
jgi:hypothetical protein